MPQNWKTYSFGDAPLEILDGDRGKNYPKSSSFTNSGYCLFLSAKNVTKRGFDFSEVNFISKEQDELLRKGKLKRKDIVLTTRGTVGNVSYYNDAVEYNHIRINSGMVIIRPNVDFIDVQFLYLYMRSKNFENQIEANQTGSAQPQLPIRDFKSLTLILPPLPEQHAIATILSSLDDKIELNLQTNKTLEEMAMTLYKHWFVDFGPFKDGKFIDSELGKIPEGWKVKRLEKLVSKLGDGLHGTPKYSIDGEYHFVNGNNLSAGRILIKKDTKTVTEQEFQKYKKELNDRTLLVSINGTIGNVAAYGGEKIMLGKSACYFNVNENVSKGYIKLVISSSYFINYLESNFTGSVIKNVSLKSMRELPIITPPLRLQQDFQDIITPLELQQDELYLENQTLTALRDTLLPKLISGEVRVKDVEQTLFEVL